MTIITSPPLIFNKNVAVRLVFSELVRHLEILNHYKFNACASKNATSFSKQLVIKMNNKQICIN